MFSCCRCQRNSDEWEYNDAPLRIDSRSNRRNLRNYVYQRTMVFLNQSRFYYPKEYIGDPSNPMCKACWNYLHDRDSRKAIDKEHFNVAHDTSSRFSPLCREFDIRYGLLNAKTNRYWDEKPPKTAENRSQNRANRDDSNRRRQNGNFSQANNQQRHNSQNYSRANQNQSPRRQNNDYGNPFYPDANEKLANSELFQVSTHEIYEDLKQDAMKGREAPFAHNFQAYIVRLGLNISNVSKKKFNDKHYYPNILGYICNTILHDSYIFNELKEINPPGNLIKHDIDNITANINQKLTHYNSMIDKLVAISGCQVLDKCHIYVKMLPNTPNQRIYNGRTSASRQNMKIYLTVNGGTRSHVYCYAYDSNNGDRKNAQWPGRRMQHDNGNVFVCEIPPYIRSPLVIFSIPKENRRFPYENAPGLRANDGQRFILR